MPASLRTLLLFCATLSACAHPLPKADDYGIPADYLPFADGRTWNYRVKLEGYQAYGLATRSFGSDVRTLPDGERVEFKFVYGRADGDSSDTSKSIYALSKHGPREFYFDAGFYKLQHEPPIPLLPAEVVIGNEVKWSGTLSINREPVEAKAVVRVEATESITLGERTVKTLRVKTSYVDSTLEITRWFAHGEGMVQMQIRGAKTGLDVRLQ